MKWCTFNEPFHIIYSQNTSASGVILNHVPQSENDGSANHSQQDYCYIILLGIHNVIEYHCLIALPVTYSGNLQAVQCLVN